MSKIKVDAVESRNGTLTLGGTGDTVVYTAGSIPNSSLDNSAITINGTAISLGASGDIAVGIDWQTTAKTADFTAVAGEGYFVNTTSGAITATLPASPSAGDQVAFKDYAETFGSNALTIARNGSNIQGAANDSIIETNRASVVLVYVDATKGWLYTVQSNASDNILPPFVAATGGTITTSGDFKIHTFTSSGTFTVTNAGTPTGSNTVDYLVVAGGGAGGTHRAAGGGAGGFRESSGVASGSYSASPLGSGVSALPVAAQAYPITVGGGGASVPGSSPAVGGTGSNSVFSTITSAGGGGGAGGDTSGADGGSGGGGGTIAFVPSNAAGAGNTPSVSPPQGNSGGGGAVAPNYGTGGGGGATAAGSAGNSSGSPIGGDGGAGATTSISASSTAYAGGGGGSGFASDVVDMGDGGVGGGGDAAGGPNASSTGAQGGTANTGGGGGGGYHPANPSAFESGGAGGSGIVIIRYKFQ